MDSSAETLLHHVEFGLLVIRCGVEVATGFMARLPFSKLCQKTNKGMFGGRRWTRIGFFVGEMVIC